MDKMWSYQDAWHLIGEAFQDQAFQAPCLPQEALQCRHHSPHKKQVSSILQSLFICVKLFCVVVYGIGEYGLFNKLFYITKKRKWKKIKKGLGDLRCLT